MTGRSSLTAFAATLVAASFVSRPARAEVHVSIQYDSEERLEAARRLFSELATEGYVVEMAPSAVASPCEATGARVPSVPRDTNAWVRLSADPSGADAVVASICYLGALPFLQQASSSAPRSDPDQLAVATAEALNGLRAKLPPIVGETPAPERQEAPPSPAEPPASPSAPVNGVGLGVAIWQNLPDYPVSPGVLFRATLGASARVSLSVEAFAPTRGAELADAEVTATVRTAWLRVGPRLGWKLGDLELFGALLAGPALTWATATARPPRVGTADVSPGALLSISAALEYPSRSPIFASASASASALLPGLRLHLADGSPAPSGSWPIDAAVGVGARFGGED